MEFKVIKDDPYTQARIGRLTTRHGAVDTPVFMPVGTAGSVKGVTPEEVRDSGAQIILGNTFHLYILSGALIPRIARALFNTCLTPCMRMSLASVSPLSSVITR